MRASQKSRFPHSLVLLLVFFGLVCISVVWQITFCHELELQLLGVTKHEAAPTRPRIFPVMMQKGLRLRIAFVQMFNSSKNVHGTFRNLEFLRLATARILGLKEDTLVYHNALDNLTRHDVVILRSRDAKIKKLISINPNLLIGVLKPYDNEDEIRAAISHWRKMSSNHTGHPRIFALCENDILQQYFSARGIPALTIRMVEERPSDVVVKDDFPRFSKSRPAVVCYLGYHGHLFGDMYWWKYGVLPSLMKWPIELKIMTYMPHVAMPVFEEKTDLRNISWARRSNLNVVWWPFDRYKVFHELATCDIGIVPQWSYMSSLNGHMNETDVVTFGMKPQCHVGRALMFMQSGVPVIVESCPDVDRLFHAGVQSGNALGLTLDHPWAWRVKLEALLSNPALRMEIARNGMRFALLEGDPATQATRLIEWVGRTYYRHRLGAG